MTFDLKLDILENKKNWCVTSESQGICFSEKDVNYYHKLWNTIFKDCVINPGDDILCINDGFQLFSNSVPVPAQIVIVDQDAYRLCESPYNQYFSTVKFRNHVDSLGKVHKRLLIDYTFDEAKEDGIFKQRYDVICLYVKSPEDLTYKRVEQYFKMLHEYGVLCVQMNKKFYTQETELLLNHYFSLLLQSVKTDTLKTSTQLFQTYNKISGLV